MPIEKKGVEKLGYIGLEVPNPEGWIQFFQDIVGLMPSENKSQAGLGFRLDEYAHRFIVAEGPSDDVAFVGWEVKDKDALSQIRERVEKSGRTITDGDAALAKVRGVEALFFFDDPNEIRTEIFWGPSIAELPFHSPHVPNGFVTGEGGLGHVVFGTSDWQATFDFYTETLGLRLSDYIKAELAPGVDVHVTFLHANPRHHSFAFFVPPVPFPKKLQHFMIEAREMSAVGRAYDRFCAAGVPISMGLGHHPNDEAFSFYAFAPNGIEIEFGWGPLLIDDDTWQPKTYSQLSDWGHNRPAAEA